MRQEARREPTTAPAGGGAGRRRAGPPPAVPVPGSGATDPSGRGQPKPGTARGYLLRRVGAVRGWSGRCRQAGVRLIGILGGGNTERRNGCRCRCRAESISAAALPLPTRPPCVRSSILSGRGLRLTERVPPLALHRYIHQLYLKAKRNTAASKCQGTSLLVVMLVQPACSVRTLRSAFRGRLTLSTQRYT